MLQLSSVTMNNAAGSVTASGTYDLHSKQFQVDARGTGIDIARIEKLRSAGATLSGSLAIFAFGLRHG